MLVFISINKLERKHSQLHSKERNLILVGRIRSSNYFDSAMWEPFRMGVRTVMNACYHYYYQNHCTKILPKPFRLCIIGTISFGHRRNCSDSIWSELSILCNPASGIQKPSAWYALGLKRSSD